MRLGFFSAFLLMIPTHSRIALLLLLLRLLLSPERRQRGAVVVHGARRPPCNFVAAGYA
jgi:hypothetical protein